MLKLSTILLCGVVIFFIYQICMSSETFANVDLKNVFDPKLNSILKTISDPLQKPEQKNLEQKNLEQKNLEQKNLEQKKPQQNEPKLNMSSSNMEAKISPEVINQVLAESESKMGVPKPVVQEGSLFNYQPNDEDVGVGASLDIAFDKPIQEGVKTDVIDLNRNNVKNYNAKDYLPKEVNDDWFNTDFSQAKYKMNDDKLINTEKYVVGVNTVGQSLKNASYDIRGAVNVPKYSVSPWNNSTTEPDYNIKPLC